MAFPTTGILDNFNRADAATLGANWSLLSSGLESAHRSQIISNHASPDGTFGASDDYWNVATYGPDCEVWVTPITTRTEIALYARITTPGAGTTTGYCMIVTPLSTQMHKATNGSWSVVGASISSSWTLGDSFGLEIIGNTLTAYKLSGGSWASYGNRTDSTNTSAGYIGIGVNSQDFDGFGGGTAEPPGVPSYSTAQGAYVHHTGGWF